MEHENYQEYQRDMADEAKQAAKENAADSTQPRYCEKRVSGGFEHYDPISGYTHFSSDYSPSDEAGDDEG